MSLPASEDTRTLRQGRVVKEIVTGYDHVLFPNTGSAINQGDFVKATPYFGIADEDIAATSGEGTVHVGQVYEVGSDRVGTSQTFDAWGQAVYYDTSDAKFYEASATGRMLVGYVSQVRDTTNGNWAFEGLRFHGTVAS